MSVKRVTRIFYIVFGLCFVLMVGIMVKGFLDQKADEKKQVERYESMLIEGGKATLTNEILEQDHDKFLKDAAEGKETFIKLLVCFGAVVVMFVIMAIFSSVMRALQARREEHVVAALITVIAVMFIFVSVLVVTITYIVPKLAQSDPSQDAYAFARLNIEKVEEKREQVTTGSGDNRSTETRITYYLIEDNGRKHSVTKVMFDRFVGAGIYYAGMTDKGNIFSVYPGVYFELEQ